MKGLVYLDRDWIPDGEGAALYIRPTMIATEAALGLRPSDEYLFFIIKSPVGAYYPEGFNPTRIYVEDTYVRAVPGGVGEAKTAGNLTDDETQTLRRLLHDAQLRYVQAARDGGAGEEEA